MIVECQNADMAKLADAPDLGSGSERSEGSSPFIRIADGIPKVKTPPLVEHNFCCLVNGIPELKVALQPAIFSEGFEGYILDSINVLTGLSPRQGDRGFVLLP